METGAWAMKACVVAHAATSASLCCLWYLTEDLIRDRGSRRHVM